MERPDLSAATPEIIAYIEALEEELEELRQDNGESRTARSEAPLEPNEPPTTMNVISISASGMAKRTPRHFYARQRRGGMGVFDLDSAEGDPPAFLVIADESASLILVTNQARAFRLAVADLPEAPVRSRGQSLLERFPLRGDERLALVFADRPSTDRPGAYAALVTKRGQVRRIGNQYLGKSLQAGTVLYNISEGGAPATVCWTTGNDELLIATRKGQAIRFAERLVPVRGCLGMRVDPDDEVVGVAATHAEGGVFLLTADGKGTIRLLPGFTANKSPGTGGKVVMKTEALIGATAVDNQQDIFVISQLGKIIRFQAAEVPAKEGVVQGVNCMGLRADGCTALASCTVAQAG